MASLLLDLEAALRNAGLWEPEAPDRAALASVQPFCIDTLAFPQWLQFVFLPRMHALLDDGSALPQKCGIAAMAEVHFGEGASRGASIVAVLHEVDAAVEDCGAA